MFTSTTLAHNHPYQCNNHHHEWSVSEYGILSVLVGNVNRGIAFPLVILVQYSIDMNTCKKFVWRNDYQFILSPPPPPTTHTHTQIENLIKASLAASIWTGIKDKMYSLFVNVYFSDSLKPYETNCTHNVPFSSMYLGCQKCRQDYNKWTNKQINIPTYVSWQE